MQELIRHISSPDHVVHLSSSSLEDSVEEVLGRLIPGIHPRERWSVCEAVLSREKLRSTVLPYGVAFPRAEATCVKKIVCGVGISDAGICFGNDAEVPVHTLFVSLYPEGCCEKFIPVLTSLIRFSQDPQKMAALKRLPEHAEEFSVIQKEVFPWGLRELFHSHLILPFHSFRTRMEAMVRVRHD